MLTRVCAGVQGAGPERGLGSAILRAVGLSATGQTGNQLDKRPKRSQTTPSKNLKHSNGFLPFSFSGMD